jgi:hypothetical protein
LAFHLPPVRLFLGLLSSSGKEMMLFGYSAECSCSQAIHQLAGYRILATLSENIQNALQWQDIC